MFWPPSPPGVGALAVGPPGRARGRTLRRALHLSLLAVVLLLGVHPTLAHSAAGSPVATPSPADPLDRRLSFETAKLALERGDHTLGERLLAELAASAATDAERRLHLLLAARSRTVSPGPSRARAPSDGVLKEPAAWLAISDLDRAPAWVESELLALASELRFEQLQRDAKARLDEVLEEHRRALGGLEHLAGLRSFVATGILEISGTELPFRLLRSRRGLYRFDLATPDGIRTEAADSQAAWRSDPRVEGGRPAYLSSREGKALRRGAELLGPLLRPDAEGRLAYRGLETIGGRAQHAIDVTEGADGVDSADATAGADHPVVVQRIYVDAETHLETRVVDLDPTGEPRLVVETELRAVDGYLLPARQTVRAATATSVFRFEDYRVNVPLDLALFDAGPLEPSAVAHDPSAARSDHSRARSARPHER